LTSRGIVAQVLRHCQAEPESYYVSQFDLALSPYLGAIAIFLF